MRFYISIAVVCLTGCVAAAPAGEVVPYFPGYVPWLPDDQNNYFLVDTGSPRTMLRPRVFDLPDDTPLFEDAFPDWQVLGVEPGASPLVVTESLPNQVLANGVSGLGGIIGADLLSKRPFALDPQFGNFYIHPTPESFAGVGDGLQVSLELRGGGGTCLADGECFDYPATRMIVEVIIDGVETHALVDTAAGFVNMTRALYDRLPKTARPYVEIDYGSDVLNLSRAATVEVGQARLDDVVIEVSDDKYEALARLHVETGVRVELLLGTSFLANYVTSIDHSQPAMTLYPYPDRSYLRQVSRVQGLGIARFEGLGGAVLELDEACYRVIGMARGHRAEAQGLRLDDCITSIAGFDRALAPQARQYLAERALGDAIRVEILRAGETLEMELELEDILPSQLGHLTH